jgi:voltage-gated potassium channel
MAALLLRPEVMNFFDVVLQQDQLEIGMERIRIAPASALDGQTLREARLRDKTGALVVGIQRGGQPLKFNPQGHEQFLAGDEILAMGPSGALDAFMKLAGGNAGEARS